MTPLLGFLLLVVVAYAVVTVGMVRVSETDPPPAKPCVGDCVPRSELVAERKRSRRRLLGWRHMERQRNGLRWTLRHRPSSVEAIKLASRVYGVSQTWMLSRGSCESTGGNGFNPNAVNRKSQASGLFQFLWSTWRSTPFASFSPFSPYANALAAGWMVGPAHRAGEWSCR